MKKQYIKQPLSEKLNSATILAFASNVYTPSYFEKPHGYFEKPHGYFEKPHGYFEKPHSYFEKPHGYFEKYRIPKQLKELYVFILKEYNVNNLHFAGDILLH